jgi:hypothetical protein
MKGSLSRPGSPSDLIGSGRGCPRGPRPSALRERGAAARGIWPWFPAQCLHAQACAASSSANEHAPDGSSIAALPRAAG